MSVPKQIQKKRWVRDVIDTLVSILFSLLVLHGIQAWVKLQKAGLLPVGAQCVQAHQKNLRVGPYRTEAVARAASYCQKPIRFSPLQNKKSRHSN
jgi:hypothetical protein